MFKLNFFAFILAFSIMIFIQYINMPASDIILKS